MTIHGPRGAGPMNRKPEKAESRAWRTSILRKRPEYLGRVCATDQKAALAAAIDRIKLNDEQRKGLMLREQQEDALMSAMTPIAATSRTSQEVRVVPEAVIRACH